MPTDSPRLVLASASPRRADLLTSAGYEFSVETADVDESVQPGEAAEAYVQRVASAKADAVKTTLARRAAGDRLREPGSHSLVLAADTAVVLNGAILGKADTGDQAVGMLTLLSGEVHEVLTGVVLLDGNRRLSGVARTRVHLLPITDDEIRAYVETGEPLGKAGGYAIQGRAARFVDWIDGSWSNVVGLPLATVSRMLRAVR
ncbi:MAG TPA: Maf family protein [Vicinamibacterales bacterium]|jgi:septum formation protein